MYIKNQINGEKIFGNLKNTKLKDAVSLPRFQKLWKIHKGLIDVCNNCEFRHMCIDSRIPKERVDGSWYHEIECNYNPFIAKWRGEDGYQSLGVAGVQSNKSGFVIDTQKVEEKLSSLYG